VNVWCSKCGKFLYEKDGQGIEGDSHGLCKPCAEHILADWERELEAKRQRALQGEAA
jgi:hypothetical protein